MSPEFHIIYIHIYIHIYICIYIYIQKEREREREIYIYLHIFHPHLAIRLTHKSLPRFRPPAPGAVALSAAAHELPRDGASGAAGLGRRAAEEDAAELGALEKHGKT